MRIQVRCLAAGLAVAFVLALGALASGDEGPIAGIVKSVDTGAGSFVVESTSKGKVRQVVIHVRPTSKVVRFTRSTDASKPGFSEQAVTLADLRPGWVVSVKAKHEGDKEVAEVVSVVHEK